MIAAAVRRYVEENGLGVGTQPENLAAMRLHRAGHRFTQQHRAGRYRLDFAWPEIRIAVEVDGPHHHRPDVAHRDALRDAWLRSEGWVVLRVNTGPTFEDQVTRVSEIIHHIEATR